MVLTTFCYVLAAHQFEVQSAQFQPSDITQHECEIGNLVKKLAAECADGYAYECNNRDLRNIPATYPRFNVTNRICLLDLSTNKVKRIYNHSFIDITDIKWLYLFQNRIDRIDSDAFAELTNLQFINLTSNRLHIPNSFGKDVFKPLVNLLYINLKDNLISSYRGLKNLLQPLEKLKSLYISGCYGCIFESGFESFRDLRTISMSGTKPKQCNITTLLNSTFTHLPQITTLYLSSCTISNVGSLAFKPLTNIHKLDISYNENLHFKGMRNVLLGLRNSTIRSINFNHIYEFYERGTVLGKNNIEPIKWLKKLTILYLDLNKIEVIEKEVFTSGILPNKLTHIMLSGNRLAYGQYLQYLVYMKHVNFLDISRQHLNYDPFLYKHYERSFYQTPSVSRQVASNLDYGLLSNETTSFLTLPHTFDPVYTCSKCLKECRLKNLTCVCIPPKLEKVKWKMSSLRFRVRNLKICPPLSLKILDASFNLIIEWTGSLTGLEKLVDLNLAENYCNNMSSKFFDTLYNLRKLNISYNFLGRILNPTNKDAGRHFKALRNLEILDLSENRISNLSNECFHNLTRLKYLNVSRNMICHWKSRLNSNCLRSVDLSRNRIEELPRIFREYLDNIASLGPKHSCNRTERIVLDLTNNPIQCNCESKSFLKWLTTTDVHVKFSERDVCVYGENSVQLIDTADIAEFVKHLEIVCFPFISVIVSSCICLLSIASALIVYRNRWKLRHLYYSTRKRHKHKGYERLFERDAFISYAKSEACFIKNKLVPALEGEASSLKVWVADRDSLAGASIAENITHAVSNCRKSVLLLSKNYFLENWCYYEMNMARIESIESNRKLLIIIVYNDVGAKEIPLEYLQLLRSECSLEYPSHPQDHEAFWTSLMEAIQTE